MKTQQKSQKHVYEIITDHVLELLLAGIIPWRMPWSEGRIPTNLITRNPYRAINVFLLAAESFQCNLFLSETQLANLGGTVPEGVGPILATHWEWVDKFAKEGEPKPEGKYPLLRYHKVYNVNQCENLDLDKLPGFDRPANPFKEAGLIITNMPERPKIEYYKAEAHYDSDADVVFMPDSKEYKSKELYYYDFFRTLVHSTGHEKRLNRKTLAESEPVFSTESLIADMAAHLLCFHAGMHQVPLKNNLNYIYGWIAKFESDPKAVVSAAVQAQKAVDYILNLKGQQANTPDSEAPHEPEESDDEDTEDMSQE